MSQVLTLQDYHSSINLQPTVSPSVDKDISYDTIVRQIAAYLSGTSNSLSHHPIQQQRAFIRHELTIRNPTPTHHYPSDIYELIDQMLAYERVYLKTLADARTLPIQFQSLPMIRVWCGDITTLIVDAIVNAANSGLLGCFQPTHLCIDNVIHAAAGPHLRDDCYTIMQKQRQSEPTGQAKITLGYSLPSKYVLHTAGPQLCSGDPVTQENARELASCYESCLNLASDMNTITSIAFCCISTGLFAFPPDHACHIAIKTVLNWFKRKGSQTNISLIVFNVFNPADEQRYLDALNSYLL